MSRKMCCPECISFFNSHTSLCEMAKTCRRAEFDLVLALPICKVCEPDSYRIRQEAEEYQAYLCGLRSKPSWMLTSFFSTLKR